MSVENGEWVMHGLSKNDPECLHTVEDLEKYIEKVGFVPLFGNEIKGFSVEEKTEAKYWWSGNEAKDPWEWRRIISARGKIAYGKFFDKKAGFISLEWLPYFVNFRRDGYDFDALWDDGKASRKMKKIMDLFDGENEDAELFSFEIKQMANFGKEGDKGFEGVMTALQMQMYLTTRDFRQKKNKKGEEYGWHVAVFRTPESMWGYRNVTAAYKESPEESASKVFDHVAKMYPEAGAKEIRKVLGIK